ncbi:MAG TPA: hypothetical protein VD861_17170 [Pyrinomonadaceae bacterium]|nr:hypothetical protein [Pyrinomonadaceae bacterium]
MSRKIARRMTVAAANPGMIPASPSDFNFNFPVSPLIGNDDVGTSDESVNPYSALFIGVLTSKDTNARRPGPGFMRPSRREAYTRSVPVI